jgi:hypothetical protein
VDAIVTVFAPIMVTVAMTSSTSVLIMAHILEIGLVPGSVLLHVIIVLHAEEKMNRVPGALTESQKIINQVLVLMTEAVYFLIICLGAPNQ